MKRKISDYGYIVSFLFTESYEEVRKAISAISDKHGYDWDVYECPGGIHETGVLCPELDDALLVAKLAIMHGQTDFEKSFRTVSIMKNPLHDSE